LDEPLNILISHVCAGRLGDVADAIATGDRQAVRRTIEGAYLAIRDDLGQHASPEWLDQVASPSALVHAICMRIADRMRRMSNADRDASSVLRDAATQAVACLCLAMGDEEETQLVRTLSVMKRHARAAEGIATRLSECPTLMDLSPHLRRAVGACVSDRIGEFASVLMSARGADAPDVGTWILHACPPSTVQQRDLASLDLDGRRDRRGIDLAAGIVEMCMKASAHALGSDAPDGLAAMSRRMAATALAAEPALEVRFRARMLAVGQIAGGDGE
jgi:hypothetical protein